VVSKGSLGGQEMKLKQPPRRLGR